jgi:hypothetical protein
MIKIIRAIKGIRKKANRANDTLDGGHIEYNG